MAGGIQYLHDLLYREFRVLNRNFEWVQAVDTDDRRVFDQLMSIKDDERWWAAVEELGFYWGTRVAARQLGTIQHTSARIALRYSGAAIVVDSFLTPEHFLREFRECVRTKRAQLFPFSLGELMRHEILDYSTLSDLIVILDELEDTEDVENARHLMHWLILMRQRRQRKSIKIPQED